MLLGNFGRGRLTNKGDMSGKIERDSRNENEEQFARCSDIKRECLISGIFVND